MAHRDPTTRNGHRSADRFRELKRVNERIETVTKQIAIQKAELKYLKKYLLTIGAPELPTTK